MEDWDVWVKVWYDIGMSENTLTPTPIPVSGFEDQRNDWSAHWNALAASCRSDAGTWYTLPDVPYKYASAIRAGRIRVFTPVEEWEVKVHQKQLYVRWVGEGGE